MIFTSLMLPELKTHVKKLLKGCAVVRGDKFRLTSRPGQVYTFLYIYKGDIISYGGDKNPKARRQYEAFRPDAPFITVK